MQNNRVVYLFINNINEHGSCNFAFVIHGQSQLFTFLLSNGRIICLQGTCSRKLLLISLLKKMLAAVTLLLSKIAH